jgi:antitoxin HicB
MATAVRRPLEEYLSLPYRIALTQSTEGDDWVAQVEELPGCTAGGDTPEKAARAIRGAMRTWIEQALREGREIPEPRASSPSGRLLLRMPQSLHAELARRADIEGVSLNQLIVGTLAGALGWRRDVPATEPVRAVEAPDGAEAQSDSTRPRTPLVSIALAINLVVVAVAGVAAIALLIVALR